MKRSYLVVALVYCAAIWWVSSQPRPPRPQVGFPYDDKAAHTVIYAGLAAVVSLGMRRADRPLGSTLQFWLPIAFAATYGLIDEIHQSFVPYRTASVTDFLADALGAALLQVLLWRYAGPPTTRAAEGIQ